MFFDHLKFVRYNVRKSGRVESKDTSATRGSNEAKNVSRESVSSDQFVFVTKRSERADSKIIFLVKILGIREIQNHYAYPEIR